MSEIVASLSITLNDLAFLAGLGNGVINFLIGWIVGKAFHPGIATAVVLFLIWTDRLRVEDPSLMFLTLGIMGAVGGLAFGLSQRNKD